MKHCKQIFTVILYVEMLCQLGILHQDIVSLKKSVTLIKKTTKAAEFMVGMKKIAIYWNCIFQKYQLFKNLNTMRYCKVRGVFLIHIATKIGLSTRKKYCFNCFNASPLKMLKNVFILLQNLLKIFKYFALTFWSCRKIILMRNRRLNFKFMASQLG